MGAVTGWLSALAPRLPLVLLSVGAKADVHASYAAALAATKGRGVAARASAVGAAVCAAVTITSAAAALSTGRGGGSGGGGGAHVAAVLAGTVWMGLDCTAVSTWAHVAGQRRVGSTAARVVYAAQPAAAAVGGVLVEGGGLMRRQLEAASAATAVALTMVGDASVDDLGGGESGQQTG